MEASGQASHGEADLIAGYRPGSVLDAGCGMGRVAIELANRGVDVVGVDLDEDLLAYARRDAPHIEWHLADLATLHLDRTFDVVAMPGNVMIFCRVEDRTPIVARLAAHLRQAVLHLVTKLVGEQGVDGDLLNKRVSIAAGMIGDDAESALLRLNPDDLPLVEGKLPPNIFAAGDAQVQRGAFVLESSATIVEDGPSLWLSQLMQAIDRAALP